jgi:hypothetical protein
MQTPWDKMSFLEKLWAVVKSAASTPVSYTPTDSSSSSFDDDDSIISSSSLNGSMSDDDSPTRGLWDPTSIYYSSMHDESTSIHSPFDD